MTEAGTSPAFALSNKGFQINFVPGVITTHAVLIPGVLQNVSAQGTAAYPVPDGPGWATAMVLGFNPNQFDWTIFSDPVKY
jgi:hypothetical protein